jgi:hypothetical protein
MVRKMEPESLDAAAARLAADDPPYDPVAENAKGNVPFDWQADEGEGDICDDATAAREAQYQVELAAKKAAANPLPPALAAPEDAQGYFDVNAPNYDADEYPLPALAAIAELWGIKRFPAGTRYVVDEGAADDRCPIIYVLGPLQPVYRRSGELLVDPKCEDAARCNTFELQLVTDDVGLKLFYATKDRKEDEIYNRQNANEEHDPGRAERTCTEIDFSKHRYGRHAARRPDGRPFTMPVAQYVVSNPLHDQVQQWGRGL